MKYLFLFSPVLVALSTIPVYILGGEADHRGYPWLLPLAKEYLFTLAPVYVLMATLAVLLIFVRGTWVPRWQSGVALIVAVIVGSGLYQLAGGLGRVASQGAGG